MPKLSVITIIYNNVRDIERTIKSVVNQSFKGIEYIIIDGGSTDGTMEVVSIYKAALSKIVSEPDGGIYFAMNKGLELATGDYVLFMNSGDEIYEPQTVERVFASAPDADIYYGETEMYNDDWQSLGRRRHKVPEKFTWRSFKYGMSISHQAIYLRKAIIEPFDVSYKYSADIDWILKAAKKAKTIAKVDGYVAKYLVGGVSKKKHRESLMERYQIFKKYYGFFPNLLNHLVIAFNLAWYRLRNKNTND
ncbi:glycosyltransferase involved in cell wall biosynthesis [Pedobacter sp. UYP30]|uniref:glycosyltransferase family 2 protein n=1 Tax=Pedobacter sp. UYP30 TaxID=1756400 RepID=UPI0033935FF8